MFNQFSNGATDSATTVVREREIRGPSVSISFDYDFVQRSRFLIPVGSSAILNSPEDSQIKDILIETQEDANLILSHLARKLYFLCSVIDILYITKAYIYTIKYYFIN